MRLTHALGIALEVIVATMTALCSATGLIAGLHAVLAIAICWPL